MTVEFHEKQQFERKSRHRMLNELKNMLKKCVIDELYHTL